MNTLVKNGQPVADLFVTVNGDEAIPPGVGVIIGLDRWRRERASLLARGTPVGIRLKSDQHPEAIAGDLARLAVVALEFPVFRDGRAYSLARLLRERWHYAGELRAVGDVLLEQLHFMQRVGFDAFEIAAADPVSAWITAIGEFSTWYQGTADGRAPARLLRAGVIRPASSPRGR
jgi:uncharacterized protein (DUF934 family)